MSKATIHTLDPTGLATTKEDIASCLRFLAKRIETGGLPACTAIVSVESPQGLLDTCIIGGPENDTARVSGLMYTALMQHIINPK